MLSGDGSQKGSQNPYESLQYPTKYTHIDFTRQVPETHTEIFVRYVCYSIMIYGFVGGMISFAVSSHMIFK